MPRDVLLVTSYGARILAFDPKGRPLGTVIQAKSETVMIPATGKCLKMLPQDKGNPDDGPWITACM